VALALRESDLHSALHLLHEVADAAGDGDGFAHAGVAALARFVASEITTLSVCDLQSGRREVVAGTPACAIGDADRAAFDRHFRGHPLVRYHAELRGPLTHRISDSVPFARFRESALYSEYYRRIGIDHAVALPLLADERLLVSFVMNRRKSDFGERDWALLECVRPNLARLYRLTREAEQARAACAGLDALLHEADAALLRIDAGHRLRDASTTAIHWLAQHGIERLQRGGMLPAVLGRCVAGLAPGQSRTLPTSQHPGERLLVRAFADPLREGGRVLVLERRRDAAESIRLDPALPLTAREREVLRWVAAGKTDRDIAAILGISPRTVAKHLERSYAKLGVETRTAAVMRALGGALH